MLYFFSWAFIVNFTLILVFYLSYLIIIFIFYFHLYIFRHGHLKQCITSNSQSRIIQKRSFTHELLGGCLPKTLQNISSHNLSTPPHDVVSHILNDIVLFEEEYNHNR